jgi:hypothetical protein
MYRAISILLAMVAIAVIFFGLSLCEDGSGSCTAPGETGGPAMAAINVQRAMVLAGLLAFVGGVTGFLRGPTTLPPWNNGAATDRTMTPGDLAHAPLFVRGAAFLGALCALAGILLPALVLTNPAPGLAAPVVTTIIVSALLVTYFGWHLLRHGAPTP